MKKAAPVEAEPVCYLYRDDAQELREDGEALVYAERQKFVITPETPCIPLYAHPAEQGKDAEAIKVADMAQKEYARGYMQAVNDIAARNATKGG